MKLTWAYETKRNGRKKDRLCVQGCNNQVSGVDYDQTLCAALRAGSQSLLCALASRISIKMRRWDFVNANLQGQLLEGEAVNSKAHPSISLVSTALVDVHPVLSAQTNCVARFLCEVEELARLRHGTSETAVA